MMRWSVFNPDNAISFDWKIYQTPIVAHILRRLDEILHLIMWSIVRAKHKDWWILITNYGETWPNVFSFQKIAVWVGGDYVGGHILWWGQLRDGGELRGRGRITAYIGHFVNICNWKRIKNWSGKYSSMFFPSSGLRHLSLGLLHSVFSYSHPDAKMRDLFVTASLNDTPV